MKETALKIFCAIVSNPDTVFPMEWKDDQMRCVFELAEQFEKLAKEYEENEIPKCFKECKDE